MILNLDDYRQHTSCVTEAERYEKSLAKPSSSGGKRNPQQEWMDIVVHCASTAPNHLKSYMNTMAGLDNIPRKEKQFINFTSNSLGLRGSNKKFVDEIWNFLKTERERRMAAKEKQQQLLKEQNEQKQQRQKEEERESIDKEADTKKSKDDEGETETSKASSIIDPKKVHKVTKKVLKLAPNKSMKLKELRKLLKKELGLPKSAKKLLKKVLVSNDKVKIDGKTVLLK
jgi:cell growth-regulating nucleolar protein